MFIHFNLFISFIYLFKFDFAYYIIVVLFWEGVIFKSIICGVFWGFVLLFLFVDLVFCVCCVWVFFKMCFVFLCGVFTNVIFPYLSIVNRFAYRFISKICVYYSESRHPIAFYLGAINFGFKK